MPVPLPHLVLPHHLHHPLPQRPRRQPLTLRPQRRRLPLVAAAPLRQGARQRRLPPRAVAAGVVIRRALQLDGAALQLLLGVG